LIWFSLKTTQRACGESFALERMRKFSKKNKKKRKKISQLQTIPLTLTQPRNEIVLFFLRKINKKILVQSDETSYKMVKKFRHFLPEVFLMIFFKEKIISCIVIVATVYSDCSDCV